MVASCTPCEASVTCSCSGHFVALMRRRRSTSASSGKLIEKGRIASPLGAICVSPWFDGWASASPAESRSAGSRLAAPATAMPIAAVPRSWRRSWSIASVALLSFMGLSSAQLGVLGCGCVLRTKLAMLGATQERRVGRDERTTRTIKQVGLPAPFKLPRRAAHNRKRRFLVTRRGDCANELVAPAGDINYEPISVSSVTQRATQCRNMDGQILRPNRDIGPNARHQILLADQLTRTLAQNNQDFQRATSERYWLVAFQQKKLCRE